MVMSKMVGARVRRKEDPRLITGSATYVDDVRLPGMLHTVIVRSMYPHGEITGYDTDAALAMPGVVAVYTGKDLHDLFADIKTEAQSETTDDTSEVTDRIPVPPVVPLAEKKVRYIGQPVAVVVAETQAQAVDAAELVMVDIDPLDAVTDLFEAMQDGAPQLYDGVPNNIAVRHGGQRGGDVDAAFASAAHTIKERIRSQRVNAVPMEGRAVAAAPDPVHGLTVWTSTQAPHWNRNRIAKALGLPQSRVRCIAPQPMGRRRGGRRRVRQDHGPQGQGLRRPGRLAKGPRPWWIDVDHGHWLL